MDSTAGPTALLLLLTGLGLEVIVAVYDEVSTLIEQRKQLTWASWLLRGSIC